MKNHWLYKIILCAALVLQVAAIVPQQAQAAGFLGLTKPDLILCNGDKFDGNTANDHPCTFVDVFNLGTVIIKFMFYLSIPATIVSFSWAGFLYLTAGGDGGKVEDAKKIFKNVAIGFAWICAAWLVVYTIVNPFLNKSAGFKLFEL